MELKRIRLSRFKAFRDADLAIGPLTVLIGRNNAGKSTVLHALAVLAQSSMQGAPSSSGTFVDLGNDVAALTYRDRDSPATPGWKIGLGWETDIPDGARVGVSGPASVDFEMALGGPAGFRTRIEYSFKAPTGRTISVTASWPETQGVVVEAPAFRDERNNLEALSERVQYGAFGAWVVQPVVDSTQVIDPIALARGDKATTVSYALRLAAPVLNTAQNLRSLSLVGPDRHVQSSAYEEGAVLPTNPQTAQQILDVLNYRDDVRDGVSSHLKDVFEMGISVHHLPPRRISLDAVTDSWKRNVVNLGSGIVQLAWIATMLELAREAAREAGVIPKPLVGIEEPELHIHPSKQPAVAKLLTHFAKQGTQIVCTSQNEHLLMALLQLVLEGELRPNDLIVHYIEDGNAQSLTVDDTGRLSGGLRGFFEADEGELLARLERLMQRG